MPDLDGISATREVLATLTRGQGRRPDDVRAGRLHLRRADAGASGFLLKRTKPEELIAAIHTIAAGDSLLSPSVTRKVIERVAGQFEPDPSASQRLDVLTPREREVLELIARGLSNTEIAAEFVIEPSTVKTHVRRVLTKLRLRDRVQAVIFAYESGLTKPGSKG